VVAAGGSRRADVAVTAGRIESLLQPEDGVRAADSAHEVVEAGGLLVMPGVIDVHTHTRVATGERPDQFFQDSIAAAFGGTTTFLAFNAPTSSSDAPRSVMEAVRGWRAATEADSAIDYALSPVLGGAMDDPVAELPAMVDAGIPTAKAFMVYDFRLDDARLYSALRTLGRAGGMLELHCEDPVIVDAAVADAIGRGDTAPRFHASSRPALAEAIATGRAMAFAEAADVPVYVVHLSSRGALEAVRAAKARGVRAYAETCPHYLTLTDERYAATDDAEVAKVVISPPLRAAADLAALWAGLADGSLDVVGTDHVPDRVAVEKRLTPGVTFDQISNGSPGIETLLTLVWSAGVARSSDRDIGGGPAHRRLTPERVVDLLATTPARLFGLHSKGAIEPGLDGDFVLLDPQARRVIRAADLHHTSDYTAYEGMPVTGAVRSVFVRGRPVIRDGAFVGHRGHGRFIERSLG